MITCLKIYKVLAKYLNPPRKFWLLSIICPLLPDADVIGFFLGIPYKSFWGHRGFFHSLLFAFIVSIFVVNGFFREEEKLSKRWILFILYFFVITSTHGALDAFTSGGLGIALLSPFENTRYFFPITPIVVSPLGIKAFFSDWGLRVIISELSYVWLPAILLVVFGKRLRAKRNKQTDLQ
jgi:inner membrane protein